MCNVYCMVLVVSQPSYAVIYNVNTINVIRSEIDNQNEKKLILKLKKRKAGTKRGV